MSPAMHAREHSYDLSESPPKGRLSLHARSPCRSPPRRGRSPQRHRRSSPKMKSPTRNKSSQKGRSATREESPKHARYSLKSGSFSRSPSPRTKRLRRAHADAERATDKDQERNKSWRKESEGNRSLILYKNHSSISKRESPPSPGEHNHRHYHRGSQSPRRPRRDSNGPSPSEHRHGRSDYRSRSLGGLGVLKRGSIQQEVENVMRCLVSNTKGSVTTRDGDHDSVSKMKAAENALEAKEKQKPSFELSGKLAEETNRVRGITLLFTEPPDARKPDIRWRLYVFKAGEALSDPLYVYRQSCYLFGRERRVADIPTDHPSCSKQHAVIQFRLVEKEGEDGLMKKQVTPYLMDLGSTNGTFLNDNQIEPQRYYELFEKDTIKFGNSSREYVLLHENSVS